MKKIIILIVPILFIIGCQSKEELFAKTCTIKTDSKNITDTEEKLITYNNVDEVTNVIITRTYKSKNRDGNKVIENIKKSAENYNNNLAKSKNIIVKNVKDKEDIYIVEYNLDVQNLTDDELDQFNLKKNSVKLFNKMKNNNIECKKAKS